MQSLPWPFLNYKEVHQASDRRTLAEVCKTSISDTGKQYMRASLAAMKSFTVLCTHGHASVTCPHHHLQAAEVMALQRLWHLTLQSCAARDPY